MINPERYKEIGARIKEAREALNISQAELASALKFSSPTAVALIESGGRKVSVERLELIAEKLQRNLNFFLDEDGTAPNVKVALRAESDLSEKDKKLLLSIYNLVKKKDARKKSTK